MKTKANETHAIKLSTKSIGPTTAAETIRVFLEGGRCVSAKGRHSVTRTRFGSFFFFEIE